MSKGVKCMSKGGMTSEQMKKYGRGLAKVANQTGRPPTIKKGGAR